MKDRNKKELNETGFGMELEGILCG